MTIVISIIMMIVRLEAERAEQRRLGEKADHEARLVGIAIVAMIITVVNVACVAIAIVAIPIIAIVIIKMIMIIAMGVIIIVIVMLRFGKELKWNKECGKRVRLAR